ncbi:hypothetical protein TrVE_jg9945 [Triparma verrucosa]|uniref:anthranilate phosphoribosyltransferase n=2 Tax=Triparma TaxID=722752 RepID=A0A9W7EXF2_9STRA|nr:hypothetical protein TrST_g7937 [Triparma strigata]GMH94812.1 hypothetical protein TrVE_jg9945 [Triparma verrucosa]
MKFSLATLALCVFSQPSATAFTLHGHQKAIKPFAIPQNEARPASSFSSTAISATSLKPYLETLIEGKDLSKEDTFAIFSQLLKDDFDPIQAGSLLLLLRQKGETSTELAGMVNAMNSGCNAVNLKGTKLLDIVGTGGDGADTINISTASVVLAAASGCIVAKAGNRSVSSACGSADVLEALGVKVDLSPSAVEKCVDKTGIAFMFAPINHPSMRFVAPVRKSLGLRSAFNILGPMTNAAGAQRAVIGVFDDGLSGLMADTLMEVGRVDHAVVIHGCGLDEISPLGASNIVEIKKKDDGTYDRKEYEFDPKDIGVERCTLEDLKGGDPEMNKNEFIKVLQGGTHNNAKRDSIVLNAGFGIYVYGNAPSVAEGCKIARETLESGKASELLEEWIKSSNEVGE